MGMEKYMGYKPAGQVDPLERELPIVDIKGTEFFVDIQKHEFRQVDNPYNRMTLGDIGEQEGLTRFFYDTVTKNIYLGNYSIHAQYPSTVREVYVPALKVLDPVGLSQRQGTTYTGQLLPPKVRELKCLKIQGMRTKKKGQRL